MEPGGNLMQRHVISIFQKSYYTLHAFACVAGFLFLFIFTGISSADDVVITEWGGDAEMIYDTGFMHMLKKHLGGGWK